MILRLLRKLNISYKSQREIFGYFFISPFILGFLMFFLYPFVMSIIFSISEIELTTGGFNLNFVGTENYSYALFSDPDFTYEVVTSFGTIAAELPIIIIFSYFVAVLLNQKFKGRTTARAIFFLPVILSAGVIHYMDQGDFLQQAMTASAQLGGVDGILTSEVILNLLYQMELPDNFVEYIITAVNRTPEIINAAAIPILIFLSGLQSIPQSLYEVADIDGATGWEKFWKVTFPLLSPMLLANVIYIIVDSFTNLNNEIISMIQESLLGRGGFGVSSAMIWLYFLLVIIFLAIIIKIISRNIIYME